MRAEKAHPAVLAALAVWLVGGAILGGILLLRHVPLPAPSVDDARMRTAVAALLPEARWRAVHVIYRACPCSRRVVAHLLRDARPHDLAEAVLVVDDDGRSGPEDERLAAAGYAVAVVTPEQLHDRYDIESAPLFVVLRPDGAVAYAGGYTFHKQSDRYEDLAIVDDLRRANTASTLPVFGCATSARLAADRDPLALRRW